MQSLQRALYRLTLSPAVRIMPNRFKSILQRSPFSSETGGGGENGWDSVGSSGKTPQQPLSESGFGFDSVSSWSTGLTEHDFEGEAVYLQVAPPNSSEMVPRPHSIPSPSEVVDDDVANLEKENRKSKAYVDSWGQRMMEVNMLLKQVNEPGARGAYLKDSEKAEIYRLHKENPEVYTIEKLAKDYRIMRQRVHAILWLKELEEEEEKKLGHPLDDSVEQLLDSFPEYSSSSIEFLGCLLASNAARFWT